MIPVHGELIFDDHFDAFTMVSGLRKRHPWRCSRLLLIPDQVDIKSAGMEFHPTGNFQALEAAAVGGYALRVYRSSAE